MVFSDYSLSNLIIQIQLSLFVNEHVKKYMTIDILIFV